MLIFGGPFVLIILDPSLVKTFWVELTIASVAILIAGFVWLSQRRK